MNRPLVLALAALATLSAGACSGTQNPPPPHPVAPTPVAEAPDAGAPVSARVEPPAASPPRDVHLPAVHRNRLPNGIEVNVVEYHTLPVLHLRLTVRAGSSTDPANLPGLASVAGDMLKEGTRAKSSAQIAETIEFVGGSMDVITGADTTVVSVAVLKDHADVAMALMAEVLTEPTFPQSELDKLRRRELDRLQRAQNDPSWQNRREFSAALYGTAHPYGRFDTTPEALRRITRADLVNFHHQRYVGGNMFLVAVGDVAAADFDALVTRTLGRVRAGTAPAVQFPAVPPETARQIYLVDRPASAQSVVRVGNPALRRNDPDFVPLSVASHLLGGGASSRLFMDLREIRSLTYGAYSRVSDSVDVGTWSAALSVRTPATGDALHALMRHLDCVTHDAPPDPEMQQTRSYLIDSFPLSIETPGNIADLVTNLRVYNLPDDYYDTYRSRVAQVNPAQELAIAQHYVHPDHAVVVVVGTADAPVEVGPLCAAIATPEHAHDTFAQQLAACAQHAPGTAPGAAPAAAQPAPAPGAPARATQPLQEVLRTFGPVRVVDLQGHLVRELTALPAVDAPMRATCEELTAPALQRIAHAEPPGRQATPPR